MKPADIALLVASAAAVVLVFMARRDSSNTISQQQRLAGAQQNAATYGGVVQNWLNYDYIDNDAIDLRGTGLESLIR